MRIFPDVPLVQPTVGTELRVVSVSGAGTVGRATKISRQGDQNHQKESNMRSQYADYFNHDDDALGYDADVRDETNPIRTGYAQLMSFVGSRVPPASRVLDLGTGTGNTILHLPPDVQATGVDVSQKMLAIARQKLGDRPATLIHDDLLNFVSSNPLDQFDAIVSTYALHHLPPAEREHLFQEIGSKTKQSLVLVFGDLMYENDSDKTRILKRHREAHPGLAKDFEEEFFWDVEASTEMLQRQGWHVTWHRFSDLSWVGEIRKAKSA